MELFREQTGVDLNFGDGIEVVILQSQKRKWLSDKYLGVNAIVEFYDVWKVEF